MSADIRRLEHAHGELPQGKLRSISTPAAVCYAPTGKLSTGNRYFWQVSVNTLYLWRAFFTNRYEKSTNSRALMDVNELKPLVTNTGAVLPTVFNDESHPLPQAQELIDAGWPVRKDRLARAILALALKQGGLDLADGGEATRASLSMREYHHLFPRAHLARLGIADERINVSLNCALITWTTNRDISDKEPERYLAERREGTELGEGEVRARLATHLIPYAEMVANDYTEFLKERAKLIHQAMAALCIGGGT